jgi:hypothetical protein
MRAELLRREFFLFRARVGPYRHSTDITAQADVQKRLLVLDQDIEEDVLALTAIEDTSVDGGAQAPFAVTQILEYVDSRVRDQRVWFSKRAVQHEHRDRRLEYAAKAMLVFALLVAGTHFTDLLDRPNHESVRGRLMLIAAFVFPPLGAALVGVRALLEGKRLSRAYQYNAHCLAELERDFVTLAADCQSGSVPDAAARFRRLVVETEELLTAELRQWWIVMHPTPSVGA